MTHTQTEISDDLQTEIDKFNGLKMEIENRDKEIHVIRDTKNQIWKEMKVIRQYLKTNCNHEWRRECYPYAPLYCTICGYERP